MPEKISEIYLDMNATTKVLPVAAQAAHDAMEISFGNPSSSHITGLKARHLMETTRELARQVLGAESGELIFNSGATEGIQTAVLSALEAARSRGLPEGKRVLLYGATEHKAVPEALKHWNRMLGTGAELVAIPVDKSGLLDFDFIARHVKEALMICTMAVNNETGCIQDLKELEKVIRDNSPDILWMVDGVQALGKCEINLGATTIDYAMFSGHKLYAVKGIGLLYTRENAPFTPIITGGGQEGGLRSGTENLPGMAALKAVFSLMVDEDDDTFKSHDVLTSYRDRITETLREAFPGIVFNNDYSCSVPTTINFSVRGFSSKEIMDLFDAASIRVSSGSACSSQVEGSFVLEAMGLEKWRSESAIRLSFGPAMTEELVAMACERLAEAGNALRQNCMILSDQVDDSETFGIKGLIQLKNGSSCTWLYCDEVSKETVVIDPLPELAERIANMVRCQYLNLKAILDTHGHADHVSCRPEVKKILAEFIPEAQQKTDVLGWPVQAEGEVILSNGQKTPCLKLGSRVLAKIKQPGHTADSVGFLLGLPEEGHLPAEAVQYAFLGDTILIGTLGRSNFVSSSTEGMFDTLHLIKELVGDSTLICPAHDYNNQFVTTMGTERFQNSLLAETLNGGYSKDHFVGVKTKLDKKLIDEVGEEVICGAYEGPHSGPDAGEEIDADTLRQWLEEKKAFSLVDIREPYEHELHEHNFGEVEVTNIPLTRLSQFVADVLSKGRDEPVVFICRSGSRSKLACEALRRIGLTQVTHVMGGYALS